MRNVPKKVKKVAINFLFPDLKESSREYEEIANFIDYRFEKIHTCVMYSLNSDFMNLVEKLNLQIGKKEIIIGNGYVMASSNYSGDFKKILDFKPFYNPQVELLDEDT